MQPYIILYKTTLQLGVRNLPKDFTRQRPGGESNRVSTIRKSDALPVSYYSMRRQSPTITTEVKKIVITQADRARVEKMFF